MENLKLTKMELSDLDEIRENLYCDFDDFWNYQIFKEELVNTNSSYLVLRYNNNIVAYGGIKIILDEAELMNIVTKKNNRNSGNAKLILNELIKIAKDSNCIKLNLEVNENNLPAIHLYELFNFKKVGLRKHYYKNTDNAILMTLDL